MPILTKIPVSSLPTDAKLLAKEIDKSRLVDRNDGAQRGDGELGPSEVRAAMANLSSFSAQEQTFIQQWAQLLGVDAGGGPSAPVKKEWQDREPLPRDRGAYSAVAVGKHLYAASGNQGYTYLHRFDPGANAWTAVERPHQRLYHGMMNDPTLAEAGDQLYAIGGHDRGRHTFQYGYRFDPAQKAWTQIANNPHARWGMGAAGHEGKLYAFGGTTGTGYGYDGSPFAGAKEVSNVAQVYDPAGNTWTDLPPLPVARAHPAVIAADGKLFVIGGLEPGASHGQASRRVDVFDPATGAWQDPPMSIPTPAVNPSAWLQDGKICVSGGHNQDQKGVRTVETLDPQTGETDELSPVKFEKSSFLKLANVDGHLLALGSGAGDRGGNVGLKELAPVDPPPGAGTSVVNIITNHIDNSVDVDVDITHVLNHIQNTTVLNTLVNVDQSTTNVFKFVDQSKQIDVDIDILAPLANFGFTDVDNNFFFRPTLKQKDLVQVGTDADGKRYLTGSAHGGKGALPKNASLCLHDPDTGRSFPFQTDKDGQFACELPDDLHGRVYLFRQDATGPASAAAPLDLP